MVFSSAIQRIFTEEGRDPVTLPQLRVHQTAEGAEYLVPRYWNEASVEMLVQHAFYKDALPASKNRQDMAGIPSFLWPASTGQDTAVDFYEKDIRDVLRRIAGVQTLRAFQAGLLRTDKEAQAFYDECRYALFNQIIAPEIAVWQSAGLNWAYGIPQPDIAPQENIALFGGTPRFMPTSVIVPEDIAQDKIHERLKHMAEGFRLNGHDKPLTVTLPVENVSSRAVITARRNQESRDLAASLGTRTLRQMMNRVMDACDREQLMGFDPAFCAPLAAVIEQASLLGVPMEAIDLALSYARQGYEQLPDSVLADIDPFENENLSAFHTALSVPDDFIETALTGHGFMMMDAGQARYHADAPQLWDMIADTIWTSGDPLLYFRDTAGSALRSASGAFLSDREEAAWSGAVNLLALTHDNGLLDIQRAEHAVRLLVILLDSTPSIVIGMAGLSTLLMEKGLAYDSPAGRSAAAVIASFISGAAHLQSAMLAKGEATDLAALKSKRAAASGGSAAVKGIPRRVLQGNPSSAGDQGLYARSVVLWDKAYLLAKETGLRHTHLTGLAVSLEMQALLGSPTRNIMPEHKLVRFEAFNAPRHDGDDVFFGKKINPAVPRALAALGYAPHEIDDIVTYAAGQGTLFDAPFINHDTLAEKGFTPDLLMRVEAALKTSAHIGFVFNRWTLAGAIDDFDGDEEEDLLSSLGFSQDDIDAANIYACGTMTLEGAPHLKPGHLAVFDGAEPMGDRSVRRVSAEGQIRMQAAIEPFLSGSVDHVVTIGHHATIEDVKALALTAWESGTKQIRLYRDGSSLLSPLAMPLAVPAREEHMDEDETPYKRNIL